jgi:hypothetical protein
MTRLILTAIFSVSLTINVFTLAPHFTVDPLVQYAENTPAQHGFDLMVKRINGVSK